MSYALSYEVPGSSQLYQAVKKAIGDEPPTGLVLHMVVQVDGGLRHVEIWDSKRDWDRFRGERVEPALHQVLTAAGFTQMPPSPPVEELALVDVVIGA